MNEVILVKYGEMALKGLNKRTFEDMLTKNIKRRLRPLGSFTLTRAQSTLYITPDDENADLSEVIDAVGKSLHTAVHASARRISLILLKRALNISTRFSPAQGHSRSTQREQTRHSP